MKSVRSNPILNIFTLFALLASLLGGALTFTPAYAAGAILVNSNLDVVADDDTCTLREAITSANTDTVSGAMSDECAAGSGADTITFAANYTITLTDQLPAAETEIIINGNGAANTIIQASTCNPAAVPSENCTHDRRVFEVSSAGNLTLDSLTVRHGLCNGLCVTLTNDGGGILNGGALTLTNSALSGNAANLGGGIFNNSTGTLTVMNSALSGNFANYGGGIHNNNTATVTSSAISDNSTTYGGSGILNGTGTLTVTNSTLADNSAGGAGAGIANYATLTLTNSALSGNSATSNGGGIYNNASALTVTVTNSTFSGNSSDNIGGGIFNNIGTLTMTNSTLSGNSAPNYGGIFNNSSATLNLVNTIIANSTNGDCVNSGGTIGTNTNNLVEDFSCSPALFGDPSLGPLADNGGSTQTHALLLGSSAIDAGTSSGAPLTDQRGVTRDANVDIGAFESEMQTGPTFTVNATADTDDGFCDTLNQDIGNQDCTLREAISAANAISGADVINIPAGTYTLAIAGTGENANATGDLDILDALTINGTGANASDVIIQAGTDNTNGIDRVFHLVYAGSVTIANVTIANGKTTGQGGGIENLHGVNGSDLTVINSIFSGNSATYGGGIDHYYGSLTVINTTFLGNTSDAGGGGIYIFLNSPTQISNSTFSGNQAIFGGGIANDGMLTVTNSTFSGNLATNGGGIFNFNATVGSVMLKNTIVANSASGGDCYGIITADTHNLDTDGTCGDAVQKTSAEIALGALADNGGATQTHALLIGSSAIDAGDDAICAAAPVNGFDQRGLARPQGAFCDIGAYEFDPAPMVVSIVRANPDPTTLTSVNFTVTFSEPVTGVDTADFSLTTTGVSGATVSGVSGSGTTRTLTVNTGGGNGTIRLNLKASGTGIVDALNNPISGGFTGGETYTVQKDIVAPTILSITRTNPNPTALASVNFTVTFSESVTGVDAADFSLTTTGVSGATVSGISGSGATRTLTVNSGSGNGTIRLNLKASGTGIVDALNNPISGGFTGGQVYNINKTLAFKSVGANDGWILESTETSAKGGTLDSAATTFRLGDFTGDKQYRAILHFDTSALPDNAVITKVTLKIKQSGAPVGTNPFTILNALKVDIRRPRFGSSAALVNSDFQAAASLANIGSIPNTAVANWYTRIWASGAFFSSINKTGSTQFRLYFAKDDNNDNAADYMKFFSGNAPAGSRPQLIVEYYVP